MSRQSRVLGYVLSHMEGLWWITDYRVVHLLQLLGKFKEHSTVTGAKIVGMKLYYKNVPKHVPQGYPKRPVNVHLESV